MDVKGAKHLRLFVCKMPTTGHHYQPIWEWYVLCGWKHSLGRSCYRQHAGSALGPPCPRSDSWQPVPQFVPAQCRLGLNRPGGRDPFHDARRSYAVDLAGARPTEQGAQGAVVDDILAILILSVFKSFKNGEGNLIVQFSMEILFFVFLFFCT